MNYTNKKNSKLNAIVLGATGMIGSALVKQLLDNEHFERVDIFVRRTSGINNIRLREYIVDFESPENWEHLVEGDVLFSCMGTTLKQAGNKENQFRIDVIYPYQFAKIAITRGISKMILVSSAGANMDSKNFYLRMKGELDELIQDLNFETSHILRPGQLYGNRSQKRILESIALKFMFFINKFGIARKYRPIHAEEVAKRMIALTHEQKSSIITLDEIFQ